MFKKINLFSKTENKILDFISKSSDMLYEKEIAQKTDVSTASAYFTLNRFAKMGLVEKTKKGRMSFYSAAINNPALRQFKIYNTVSGLSPVIEKLSPFSKRIILFGSCARGANTDRSDIDLFILSAEKDKIRRLLDAYPLIQAIILNSSEWVILSKSDKPLHDRISAGIVLWEAENGPEL